jgi:hypothetical protein
MKLGRIFIFGLVLCLVVGAAGAANAQNGLTAWTFIDMQRADQPNLIVQDKGVYRLQADWEAARIEYLYEWWGYEEPSLDYQHLERAGEQYQNGNTIVDAALVKDFLGALTNLYSTQFLLVGRDHSDDYPSWMIELTGEDGQHIQLFSDSTANFGSAPWNVLYNGRMYAQYDGTLAEPFAKLFNSKQGQPIASFLPGYTANGTLFSTAGWPAQLTSGFFGLLPIADGFHYTADLNEKQLRGTIEGRSSIDVLGSMVIGTITDLVSIEITADDTALDCSFEKRKSHDPLRATWDFTCEGVKAVLDQPYDYPITVTFGTNKGKEVDTTGRLQGVWHDEDAVLLVPIAEQLRTALESNADAADLLRDHMPIRAYYSAALHDPTTNQGVSAGEIILLGEVAMDEGTLRYSLGTPFAVKDGKLTVWTLTRDAIQQMLANITDSALTKRIVKARPNVILNLWYTKPNKLPQPAFLRKWHPPSYGLTLEACGDRPRISVPDAEPLQAFAFDNRWEYGSPDFVLIDG